MSALRQLSETGSIETTVVELMRDARLRAQVVGAVKRLDELEERKKQELAALSAQFREEREELRSELRASLDIAARDLRDRLHLPDESIATRLLLNFETVQVGQIAAVFGWNASKLVHIAEKHPQPTGLRCPRCKREHLAGRNGLWALHAKVKQYGFDGDLLCCDGCWPSCSECGVRFSYPKGVTELHETIEAEQEGHRFSCVGCSEKREHLEAERRNAQEFNDAITGAEWLAGAPVSEAMRDVAWECWRQDLDATRALFKWLLDTKELGQSNLLELLEAKLTVTAATRATNTRRRRDPTGDRVWTGTYDEYLASPEWRSRREWALERADRRCQLCNTTRTPLHVHHRTYERLGAELPSDVIVLCGQCHQTFHDERVLER